MGSSDSKNQYDNELIKILDADTQIPQEKIKVLILGAGDSGKSTLIKQMKILYKSGYSDAKECTEYKSIIIGNAIQSLKAIIRAMSSLCINFANPENPEASIQFLEYASELERGDLTLELVNLMIMLWFDSNVQECLARSREYQLGDNAAYFLDSLDRISEPDYVPTQQDILRSQITTTGLPEYFYDIKGLNLRIFDVGGKRSERRKWVHVFENVSAIVFCVALSEYDLMLWEDEGTNRMEESMLLFDSICNSPNFKDTPIVLLFTKMDIFKKKILKSPLTICFPEYTGSNTYEEALSFIRSQFESLNKQEDQREFYTHFTCAVDVENMQSVLNDVIEVVIKNNLNDFVPV